MLYSARCRKKWAIPLVIGANSLRSTGVAFRDRMKNDARFISVSRFKKSLPRKLLCAADERQRRKRQRLEGLRGRRVRAASAPLRSCPFTALSNAIQPRANPLTVQFRRVMQLANYVQIQSSSEIAEFGGWPNLN